MGLSVMHDVIRIEGIDLQAFVGIYPHEHEMRQPLVIDLALYLSLREAGLKEDIAKTLDYDDVVQLTQTTVQERHYKLVETLAETIATRLKDAFAPKLEKIRVRVTKPRAVFQARRVQIEIIR
jgi:7,8-dihydroneopterin aldolase/epimerase/oxygenase